jgi:hypothetical protein
LVALALAGTAGATAPREVTLRVHAPFDPGIQARNISFSGRVSNGRAGEVVEMQARECRRGSFYRLIAGTRTVRGGFWVIDNNRNGVDIFEIPLQAAFRARWRGAYSRVVTVSAPLPIVARWNPDRRTVRVSVLTGRTEFLLGRLVEVQRKTGAGWLRVKRGRLVRTRDGSFVTIFRVPTRGLTLRVFAPHATGAPCFSAAASNTWRS